MNSPLVFSSKPDDIGAGQGEGSNHLEEDNPNRRFLQCPASVTVRHLKKFIMTKYGLDQNFLVDVIYKEDLLPEDHTLTDVAYRYNWRKVTIAVLTVGYMLDYKL